MIFIIQHYFVGVEVLVLVVVGAVVGVVVEVVSIVGGVEVGVGGVDGVDVEVETINGAAKLSDDSILVVGAGITVNGIAAEVARVWREGEGAIIPSP